MRSINGSMTNYTIDLPGAEIKHPRGVNGVRVPGPRNNILEGREGSLTERKTARELVG